MARRPTQHAAPTRSTADTAAPPRRRRRAAGLRVVVLALGRAGVPVPLLLHGHRLAADASPTPSLGRRLPAPGEHDAATTTSRSTSASTCCRALVNSGIFTGGVLLCTVVFGVLAGYALARCCTSAAAGVAVRDRCCWCRSSRSSCCMIPLYVLIVAQLRPGRHATSGMILPFAINSTAVFIFRQFFLQLPEELFDAARIDGASELRILWSIALPAGAAGAAHRGPAHLHRSVERVPLAVPGHQGAGHAAARGVAGQLHHQRRRPRQPTRSARSSPARCVLAAPGGRAVRDLPAALHGSDIGSGVKG